MERIRREILEETLGKWKYHFVIDVEAGQRRLTLEFDHAPNYGEIQSELAKWLKRLRVEGWIKAGDS